MTIENMSKKFMDFYECYEGLLSSTPCWNVIGKYGGGVVLASSRGEQKFNLGKKQFHLLQNITFAGLSHKEYAAEQNNSHQTIRNRATSIYRKFDIAPGSDRQKRVKLIVRLIELGVLTFEPRIPKEDWLGIRESTP